MEKMPTNGQAISKIASVLSTKVFDAKGEQIITFIKENPVEDEHPYESALRLGLAALFATMLDS